MCYDDHDCSVLTSYHCQGIKTKQKGVCGACEKPIVGQVVTALGRTWHPEHFTCFHCNQELGTQNFFERDGKPYCEHDYHALFSPRQEILTSGSEVSDKAEAGG